LFNQKKTEEQEREMKILTNQLVDMALKNDGTFYLPYRLHIDKDKMRKSYPQADKFFELKLKYDPNEIFNNKFYFA
jgi:FAD/FMN-containing dehydrogenase